MDITSPLRLAVGSHDAGSGKGCAMNVISWENGDREITDMPTCADPLLARVVQDLNDSYCVHRDRDLLCPPCSVDVLFLAHRTVGTTLALSDVEQQQIYVQLARTEADGHNYERGFGRSVAAYVRCTAHASSARVAAGWASCAITNTPADATPADRIRRAHGLIDRFEALTGVRAQPVAPEVTAAALTAMACPTP